MTTEAVAADDQPFAAGNQNELLGLDLKPRRRWPFLILGAALGAAGVVGAQAFASDGDGSDDAQDVVQAELATAEVRVQDLVDEVEWIADLGYGDPLQLTAAADATVTGSAPAGSVLVRGDVAFELDNEPVTVFYGDLPFWRDLGEGDEGPDVEQLETNLVALGYDPDTTVTIDDEFTANTALMVERWQEDIGADVTGDVVLGSVVTAPGPVSVDEPASVGTRVRAGGVIASMSARTQTMTVTGQVTGAVTTVAEPGSVLTHGDVLYEADGVAVQALTSLDSIAQLLVDPTADPVTLEGALVFGGYDPDAAIEVDATFDDATRAAVERWQRQHGLVPTGETDPGAYVLLPEGFEVTDTFVEPGGSISVPRPVLQLGAPTLSVVVPVGLADQDDFAVGLAVLVELPDETVVPGQVIDVGTVTTTAAPGDDPLIDVTVELTELADDDLPASEVTVIVAGDSVLDVMVVPTRALVTLAEGGFAVEKLLADGATILVAVETGSFDDGVVEVESSQLEPGDQVVVPQ